MQLRGSVIHKPARVPLSVLVTYAIKTLKFQEIHGQPLGPFMFTRVVLLAVGALPLPVPWD